jgi:hypothetical protein
MTKVYALLPKRPDITAEQFHEHWRTRELRVIWPGDDVPQAILQGATR